MVAGGHEQPFARTRTSRWIGLYDEGPSLGEGERGAQGGLRGADAMPATTTELPFYRGEEYWTIEKVGRQMGQEALYQQTDVRGLAKGPMRPVCGRAAQTLLYFLRSPIQAHLVVDVHVPGMRALDPHREA